MRLDDENESGNFEVQNGRGGGGGFGFGGGGGGGLGGGLPLILGLVGSRFGCGGIVVVLIVLAVLGMNPLSLIGGGQGLVPQQAPTGSRDANQLTPQQHLMLRVLGSTERRWTEIFSREGSQYRPTTLVFYNRAGQSGCGAAQSAMGPFYCPSDERIYLDTSFFDELASKYRAPGDFVEGYVLAHEVGHHVQKLTGTADKVRAAQSRASEAEGNALQVRMELQADCYAGVWAANDRNLLEPGDVEEGLRAAQAIGDDTLQQAAGQRVVPESFTHGTSAQRAQWLQRGLKSGDPASCDTFGGAL